MNTYLKSTCQILPVLCLVALSPAVWASEPGQLDSTGQRYKQGPTTLTLSGGIQRGVGVEQDAKEEANWIVGGCVNLPLTKHLHLQMELFLWKMVLERGHKWIPRVSLSAKYAFLNLSPITLFGQGGIGTFIYSLPASLNLGGGMEYAVFSSAKLTLGGNVLVHYHSSSRESFWAASPLVLTLGVNISIN
jgi:hypothetical protein